MIFVFDTNTLVSAILKPQSIPFKALETGQKLGSLIFSVDTASELMEVIQRKKFDKYLPLNERIEMVESVLVRGTLLKIIKPDHYAQCRDPKDIKFLTLALENHVDCIISGDIHLTELHPLGYIPILNPSSFLLWIEEKIKFI